jgi:hypothetical protein
MANTLRIRDSADTTIAIDPSRQTVLLRVHDPKSPTGAVEREIELSLEDADLLGLQLIRNAARLREEARQEWLASKGLDDPTVVTL